MPSLFDSKMARTFYRKHTLLVAGSLSAVDEFEEEDKNLMILCVFPAVRLIFLLLFERRKSLFVPPLCLIRVLSASSITAIRILWYIRYFSCCYDKNLLTKGT